MKISSPFILLLTFAHAFSDLDLSKISGNINNSKSIEYSHDNSTISAFNLKVMNGHKELVSKNTLPLRQINNAANLYKESVKNVVLVRQD